MKLGLINSAFVQAGYSTEFGIKKIKEIGFDSFDVFADPLDIDASERRLIKDTADRVGLPIPSLCCVALGLSDFNPSVQRFHLERCREYLNFAAELGCENLLLVLGEYIWQQEVIPPVEQWNTAVTNTRVLADHARQCGVEIAIELEPFDLSLVNSIETMLAFLEAVGCPDVRANCDISHLYLQNIPASEIRRLSGNIAHVHLSDCNGKVHGDLPPGHGVVPIADYLEEIRNTGFDGTVSIELEYPPNSDVIVEWITEAYRETDKMMRELGCRDRSGTSAEALGTGG